MLSGDDSPRPQVFCFKKLDMIGCPVVDGETKGCVEVTIVKCTIPTDCDLMPAHQPLYRKRIEGPSKQFEIILFLILPTQLFPESSQRHIGNGEKMSKPDSETVAQLTPVVFF